MYADGNHQHKIGAPRQLSSIAANKSKRQNGKMLSWAYREKVKGKKQTNKQTLVDLLL
jgi:hypothetical protein